MRKKQTKQVYIQPLSFCTFAVAIAARLQKQIWKDAGAVERDGLENRYAGNCIGGSNPPLSAAVYSLADKQFFIPLQPQTGRDGRVV